ncbi:MAG: radical SAM protein [Candidatus Bathyarchaeia archaeon]
MNEKDFLSLLESGAFAPKPKEVRFYAPSFTYYKTNHFCSSPTSFPTISITGTSCALNCKHCGGKVLETMYPALSPEELFELCLKLKQAGAQGCLVSGGCLPDGSVPLNKFVSALRRIKGELGLKVFVHTGVINLETAGLLKAAGVDAALIDIIGSAETVAKIYNLKETIEDYVHSLKALCESGLDFVPHVIVGLNEGKLDGELEALRMIRKVTPSALVIIAFMPIHGTAMAKVPPPKPVDIAKVALIARLMFPETPLVLGCMRPKGAISSKTDILALKAGVDGVAFPSEEAVKYAESKGYQISFSPYCCAQIYLDAKESRK